DDTARQAPEFHRLDAVDDVPLEGSHEPDIAPQADVVREEAHQSPAHVPTKLIVRRRHLEERAAINLGSNQADSACHVGAQAGSDGPSNGNAGDHVRHQIDRRVMTEIVLRTEEAGTVSEVHLSADDAAAHPAAGDTDTRARVIDVTSELSAGPGTDISL